MNFMNFTSFHLIPRSFVKNNFISFHFTSLVEESVTFHFISFHVNFDTIPFTSFQLTNFSDEMQSLLGWPSTRRFFFSLAVADVGGRVSISWNTTFMGWGSAVIA